LLGSEASPVLGLRVEASRHLYKVLVSESSEIQVYLGVVLSGLLHQGDTMRVSEGWELDRCTTTVGKGSLCVVVLTIHVLRGFLEVR
jgi:hypothetical protein